MPGTHVQTASLRLCAPHVVAALAVIVARPPASAQQDGRAAPSTEHAATRDGRQIAGRLEPRPGNAILFVPADSTADPIPLEAITDVRFDAPSPGHAWTDPPFRILIGADGQISGRLESLDDESIHLAEGPGGEPLRILRDGVRAVIQRPGDALMLLEPFDTLDDRWTRTGTPSLETEPRIQGTHGLRIPAGGVSLTHRLASPLPAGTLELAYFDTATVAPGQTGSVELTFQDAGATPRMRTLLGFDAPTLAVESMAGPRLAIQSLERRLGWHRLLIRFGPEGSDIQVDGVELAHGDAPPGPLIEISIATRAARGAATPQDLALVIDDLRLSRRTEPPLSLEMEPTLDEVRLASGDQLFGHVSNADPERVRLRLGQEKLETHLGWSEVSGLYFRRDPSPSRAIAGTWVRAEWQAGAATQTRQLDRLEGVLTQWRPDAATIEVPYLGAVSIPRPRIRRLTVINRAVRQIVDPGPYHLGDRASAELDPALPDGSILDREFQLGALPPGDPSLSIDVVGLVGVEGTAVFSEIVKRGELRTRVRLNGQWLDDLNTHLTTPNTSPVRVYLPIPSGLLKPGPNALHFEQTGTQEDPTKHDNMALSTVAIEWPLPPLTLPTQTTPPETPRR